MTEEVWKQVPGYTYYDVSTHGRVRSWKNGSWGRRKEPRLLKTPLNGRGYPMVGLRKKGRRKTFCVHTLVLITFVGPRPSGLECCHADGTRTNNHFSNLRWDTKSANVRDAVAHGTVLPPCLQGERHGQAKLTEGQVIEIRLFFAAGGITYPDLGMRFGVTRRTISDVVRRKTWAHVSAPEGE